MSRTPGVGLDVEGTGKEQSLEQPFFEAIGNYPSSWSADGRATEYVPVEALLVADRVSILMPVVLPGLKDALTPRGKPEADKLAVPAKPFCGVTRMVDVALATRARGSVVLRYRYLSRTEETWQPSPGYYF